jgi:hypothetical protein
MGVFVYALSSALSLSTSARGLLIPLPKQCPPFNSLKGVVVLGRVDTTLKGHAHVLHCFCALSVQSLVLSKVDRTVKFFIPLK